MPNHGASHQAGDKEVEKPSLLHEVGDDLPRLHRQQLVFEQGGAAKDGEDGAAPQIFTDRHDPLPQLGQQGAQHEHQRQRTDHAQRQRAIPARKENTGRQPQKYKERHTRNLLAAHKGGLFLCGL